jgi:ribonuclease HI/Fe2+ transport system protein FeoA
MKGDDVDCGIYGERPKLKASVSMGKEASIFQAEVFAINKCAEINLDRSLRNQHIYINSDSQAALLALRSPESNSKLVQNCINSLNALANAYKVTLRWVPGHSDIDGNEKADKLARKGAERPLSGPEPFCGITKRKAYSLLHNLEKTKALELWMSSKGSKHSKSLIKGYNNKMARELLQLKRHKTCTVTRTRTGHCKLNKHLFQMGMKQDAVCGVCQESEETATPLLLQTAQA